MQTPNALAATFLLVLAAGCDCGSYRRHGSDGGDDTPEICDRDPFATGCPCDENPRGAGCPCDTVEPEICFDGPPGAMGVGPCRGGLRSCTDGEWGACVGETIPAIEECNDVDDDCDGTVDEEMRNACGDCNDGCTETTWGDGDGEQPFEPDDENSAGVVVTEEGALTLEGDHFDLDAIWIPNSPEGTISKVSTSERVELSRYRTGPLGPTDNPSRTSLDYVGSAYVANRAFGAQASVSKFLDHDCGDTDGDGRVETSSEGTDVLDWDEDECLAWNTPVGGASAIARAVAVQTRIDAAGDAANYTWVGLFSEQRVIELDSDTGEPTGVDVALAGCSPYGAAADRDGVLWVSCGFQSEIGRVDTANPDDHDIIPYEGFETIAAYGITVDGDGRVWVAGYYTDSAVYDPAADEWSTIPFSGHGVAVSADSAWLGGCGGGVCRVDLASLEVTSLPVESDRGVAVDLDGMIWTIPLTGRLSVIDPETEEAEAVLQDCGGPCLYLPYAYSDMTGFQLRNATTSEGFWRAIVEGCEDGPTRWVTIGWEADLPDDTSLRFRIRSADDAVRLETAAWSEVATTPADESPVSIEAAAGDAQFLEVEVILGTGAHGLTPVVHAVSVMRSCPGGFR